MTPPEKSYSDEAFLDDLEDVLVSPGRRGVVILLAYHRPIKLKPEDAREIARRLVRAAEVAEE